MAETYQWLPKTGGQELTTGRQEGLSRVDGNSLHLHCGDGFVKSEYLCQKSSNHTLKMGGSYHMYIIFQCWLKKKNPFTSRQSVKIKGMYKMNGMCVFEKNIVSFFLRSAIELIQWDFSSKNGLLLHQSVLLWYVFAYSWVYTFRNVPAFSFKLMPEFLPKRCCIFYQDCKNIFLFLFPKLWL